MHQISACMTKFLRIKSHSLHFLSTNFISRWQSNLGIHEGLCPPTAFCASSACFLYKTSASSSGRISSAEMLPPSISTIFGTKPRTFMSLTNQNLEWAGLPISTFWQRNVTTGETTHKTRVLEKGISMWTKNCSDNEVEDATSGHRP